MQRLIEVLDDWPLWNLPGFAPKLDDLQVVAGGLTNQSWRFGSGGKDYLIRLEAVNSSELDINRNHEWQLQQMAAAHQLAPELLYRCDQKNYVLREYITGASLTAELITPQQIRQVASQLKKLHGLPLPNIAAMDLTKKIDGYWQGLLGISENQPLARFQPLLGGLQQSSGEQFAICHMDCGLANWLAAADQQLWLMDWEYAAVANPYWDLAALIEEQKLSAQQLELLFEHYGDIDLEQLNLARQQMQYLATLWYRLQKMHSIEQTAALLNSLVEEIAV